MSIVPPGPALDRRILWSSFNEQLPEAGKIRKR